MKIHHTSITVKDLEVTAKFYKDIFGFEESKRFGRPELGRKGIHLELNGTYVELFQFDQSIENKDDFFNAKVLGYKHIGIEAENINQTYNDLKAKGVSLTEVTKGSIANYFYVQDPDGLPIEVFELLK
jgi:catechol 2,3-dioxygenase-like lactoylglutathione lyase family enzyme